MVNNAPSAKKPLSPWQALSMVWDILFAIAVPTVIFGLGGRYLDAKFGTNPFFVILGLALSLVFVAILVTRKARDIAQRL